MTELFRQRVSAIACGYPDANDAARLADDPIHKLLIERDPIDGDPLASQPTLSRFENAGGPRVLYRLGEALAEVATSTFAFPERVGPQARRAEEEMGIHR